MRLHYYEFPGEVDSQTMYVEGADSIKREGDCKTGCCIEADPVISGVSISRAKQLLKKYGGHAWTYHCDRDGGGFETTEIKIKGNNSTFKYNRHL